MHLGVGTRGSERLSDGHNITQEVVASACNGLEWVLGPQPEMGHVAAVISTGSQPTTRLAVSDKGPHFLLCRKDLPQRQKVVKQSIIKRKKRVQDVWIDTRADSGERL